LKGPRVQGSKGPRVLAALLMALLCVISALVTPAARTLRPLDLWTFGPTRIVSLVPAVTEMLFAIGAGPQVVGVSSYDRFPAEVLTRPKVGALVDPDFERILSLRPDLVVVYGTQTDLIARLDRAHVATFKYELFGLAEITRTIRLLGDQTGGPPKAVAGAT